MKPYKYIFLFFYMLISLGLNKCIATILNVLITGYQKILASGLIPAHLHVKLCFIFFISV